MSAANKEEIWRSIITGIVNVAPQDRLAVVSRLILSNEDAASVAGGLLESATAMIRINVPVSEWLPKMVRSKEINPMMSVLPLDIVVRSQADFDAVKDAFEAKFYIRSLQVDVLVELLIIKQLRTLWYNYNGPSAEGSPQNNVPAMDLTPTL